jgi:hypothetical protein
MADKNHHFAIKMLHHHGFITRSDVTSQFVGWDMLDDIGRADIFCARMGKAVNIEVKRGVAGFNLDEWREEQRYWAYWTSLPPFQIPYYLYLTIGKHPAHYNADNYMPRRSWLIPREDILRIIETVQTYQKTLPYKVAKGMKREVQQDNIDAITLLADYELVWQANGTLKKPSWHFSKEGDSYGGFWVLPKTHIFYQDYNLDEKFDKQNYTLGKPVKKRIETRKKDTRYIKRRRGRKSLS